MSSSFVHRPGSRRSSRLGAVLATALLLAGTLVSIAPGTPARAAGADRAPAAGPSADRDTLRASAPRGLRIGVAVAGGGHHLSADYPEPFPRDPDYRAYVGREFSSITAENQMKWDALRPSRDTFDFRAADDIVDFAEQHGQVVRGHTLMWHNQNPAWLEEGDFTADELRAILEEHVTTVVGRYAGRIQQWEVVNEIVGDDAELRTEQNIWLRELGPGIIADVFRWAHEADPEAQLMFNDYSVEGINAKSTVYYELIRDLRAQGVPVHGMGLQTHLSLNYGFPESMQANLQRFDDLGLTTAVTEIDIRGPVAAGDEDMTPELRARQADHFSRALQACLAVDGCRSFTVWGVLDQHSWVPNTFAGENDALLLEGDYERKPAYCSLQRTLVQASRGGEYRWNRLSTYRECRDLLSRET